jgi:ankyrin repeat protein
MIVNSLLLLLVLSIGNIQGAGDMALINAALSGDKAAVYARLKYGANPNALSTEGYSAVEEATYRGRLYDVGKNMPDINARLDIVKLLLERGGELRSTKIANFDAALATDSLVEQRYDVTEVLLKHGSPQNAIHLFNTMRTRWPLRPGSRSKQRKFFEMALTSTANPKYLNEALFGAIESSDPIYFLSKMLRAGADINYDAAAMGTPLWHAVQNQNIEAVKFLLENGADPNLTSTPLKTAYALINMPDGSTPLASARRKGSQAIITLLQKAGARE